MINNLFQILGYNPISTESYNPYNKGLSWVEYSRVYSTNAIVRKVVMIRKANIFANGWDINCTLYRSSKRNQDEAWAIYNLLEKNLLTNQLIAEYATLISIYGICYMTFNEDDRPVLHSPDRFNLYYDSINKKIRRVAMIIDGVEQKGALGNMEIGKDIYILRDQSSSFKPLPDSFIDACYGWILLHEHALQINNSMVSSGWLGTLVGIFEKEMQDQLDTQDDEGIKTGQRILDSFYDKIKGIRKRFIPDANGKVAEVITKEEHKIAFLTGIKEFLELGKTNKDMELAMLLDKCEQMIYEAAGLTKTGNSSTYNNAQTFMYQEFDMIGRDNQRQFEDCINSFVLPHYGVETSKDLFFRAEEANDPDQMDKNKFYLELFKETVTIGGTPEYKLQVINELRDKLGLDQIEANLIADQAEPLKQQPPVTFSFAKDVEVFAKKTPTEKALSSRDYQRREPDPKEKARR